MLSTGVFCGVGETVLMSLNAKPRRPLPFPWSQLAHCFSLSVQATNLRKLIWQLLSKLHSLILYLQTAEVDGISANVTTCRGSISVGDLPGRTIQSLESTGLGGIERNLLVLGVSLT
jgi:hypothetical protein